MSVLDLVGLVVLVVVASKVVTNFMTKGVGTNGALGDCDAGHELRERVGCHLGRPCWQLHTTDRNR